MSGLYDNEINFNVGLLLGVIGFAAAILGGLGNLYGAILGGFLFAPRYRYWAARRCRRWCPTSPAPTRMSLRSPWSSC